MSTKKKAHRGSHEVDVEDFNPKPIPAGEIEKLMASAPDYIKKRAQEWAKSGAKPGSNSKV